MFQTVLSIVQVALGLGFVIFVHELGHFLVAKACGVRCDKFMIGFDIGGMKLSKQWGETEYGIGILPLGGYVKMFGQDDNVANTAEEMQRSKALEGSPDAKEVTGPDGKKIWIDKRSYLAKSVPQRMAIISAGVIMNIIFAYIMAVIAFGVGVPEMPAVVGRAVAGSPAWEAGLKTGDRFLQVNDVVDPTYQKLTEEVILGDQEKGVTAKIEHPDGTIEELTIFPKKEGKMPQIGVASASRPFLAAEDAVAPHTPAAALGDKGFQNGDQIVQVGDQSIKDYADLAAVLESRRDEPLTYTVMRGGKPPKDDPFGDLVGGKQVTFTVEANPMERLGIVPKLGPVVGVVKGSPADEAGIKSGDQITALDGIAIGSAPEGEEAIDPVLLENRLVGIAKQGESVTLTIERDGEPIEITVSPQQVTWQSVESPNDPKAYDALGIATIVEPIVVAIVGGSPAAEVDLQPGDHLIKATVSSSNPDEKLQRKPYEVSLGENAKNAIALLEFFQDGSSDLTVELLVARPTSPGADLSGAPTHTVTLKPQTTDGLYTSARGMRLQRLERIGIADSFGEQLTLAWDSVVRNLTMVVRFLQGLGTGQVSASGAGGPILIATVAGEAASRGFGALLMILVMLSANLAVLNFLPIPVLDGGHMMFLLYEGITGRPVNERVMIVLQTIGLLFLLSLMLFVTTNDIGMLYRMFF